MTPADAKVSASKKLKFFGQYTKAENGATFFHVGDLVQIYSGSFDGLDADRVQMEFLKDHLIAVAATLKSERSAKATWTSTVSAMKQKYGAPNAKATKELSTGERQSKWKFDNDTSVSVNLFSEKQGQSVVLALIQMTVFEKAEKKSQSDDFANAANPEQAEMELRNPLLKEWREKFEGTKTNGIIDLRKEYFYDFTQFELTQLVNGYGIFHYTGSVSRPRLPHLPHSQPSDLTGFRVRVDYGFDAAASTSFSLISLV